MASRAVATRVPAGPPPDWLAGCTDQQLRSRLGGSTTTRGAAYARQGRVLTISCADGRLVGQVRGSGRRYTTVVTSTGGRVSGRCSCPMRVDCKHVAAVVLHAREALPELTGRQALPGRSTDQPRARPAPPPREAAWERALTGLVEAPPDRSGVPLALQVELAGRAVLLRPLRLGASGKWVRTGASWRDVVSPYGLAGRQREALVELCAAWRARQPAWSMPYPDQALALETAGLAGWPALAQAVAAGVVLLDAAGRPTVRLAERPADVVGTLRRDGGSVLLDVGVRTPWPPVDGPLVAVGSPPTGVAATGTGQLLLAPFDQPLDPTTTALIQAPPLRVPDAELPRFWRRYYPSLRRRVEISCPDGTVEVPDVEPPRLALDVTFDAGHVTTLAWAFGYPLLGQSQRAPLSGPCPDLVRDEPAERALLDALAQLPDVPGVWTHEAGGRRLPLPEARLTGVATARFAGELLPALQVLGTVDVAVTGTPAPYAETAEAPLITVATSDGVGDWFDLAVTVTIAGQDVPMAQLIAALAGGAEHLVLDSGTYFALDRPELRTLRRLVEEARELQDAERPGLRLTPLHAGLWQELVELGVVASQSERWTRTVTGLLNLRELAQPEPPRKLQAELRDYQQDGYAWLSLLWDLGLGGILADDMGLGKTVQTLAMATRAYEQGELDAPLLVVAPTSVVAGWAAEAERFCPDLPVVTVTETQRRSGVPLADRIAGAALVVTSYALLRLDEPAYLAQPWSGLVLDEAQHVKNSAAKTYSVARRLPARFKLAITGTPLENSLMDLWSMLSITAPGLFPDPVRFAETWRRPIESGQAPEQLAALRRRIRPLLLRRTKDQVAADLPPKIEQVLEVALTPTHRRVYDTHLQRERQRVLGLLDDLQRNRFLVFKSLTVLRQLSLDPALVDAKHASVGSAKIDALVESLHALTAEGHRALVFSSFTGFLAKVRARLDAEQIGYCYLDGRTRDRARRIEQFRAGTDPAFLISLKAGGTGLTLTEADYVFVLDPWWNPAVEAQAVDRAHRIGQTRSVNVYRLVSAGTIEEKVVALQQRKRKLFTAVVDGDGAASAALTADDIRALLA